MSFGLRGHSHADFPRLIEACNAEMSKAVLGNTLTTEASDTGTQALGTVHKKEEEGLTQADRTFVLNVLNFRMTDIFRSLGIDTDGGEFIFADTSNTSPKEKAELLSIARNQLGLPIDDDYIYQELGIEKPGNYDQLKEDARRRNEEAAERLRRLSSGGREALENRGRFFGSAPGGIGASDW